MRLARIDGGGVRLAAPAKVNLSLDVLGRRPDGYHDLETVMAPVSLFDALEARPAAEGVSLAVEGAAIPADETNLVLRAWRAAEALAGRPLPARLRLAKRIPAGAGMGGGSSDAAAALLAAAALHGLAFPLLAAAAERIGSDVPFFLQDGFALCTGRGERVEPFPGWPGLWLVILFPGFSCPTAAVYARHDALAARPGAAPASALALTPPGGRGKVVRDALATRDIDALRRALWNGLEPAIYDAWPTLTEIRDTMTMLGVVPARVTGSGSALYGVFAGEREARAASGRLSGRGFETVFCARAGAEGAPRGEEGTVR